MKGLTKAQLALLAIKKKMKGGEQEKPKTTEKPIPLPQSFDELKARRKGQGFYVDKHNNIQHY
jgi:hypothetical protein